MDGDATAIGIELVVGDLDRSIELLSGVLGCDVLSRGPAELVAGEMAVLDAGSFVVSLLCPAASGEGAVLSERTPRLSQIIFSCADDAARAAVHGRATEAGLSTSTTDDQRFHITPESIEGALGMPTAIVITTAADP